MDEKCVQRGDYVLRKKYLTASHKITIDLPFLSFQPELRWTLLFRNFIQHQRKT